MVATTVIITLKGSPIHLSQGTVSPCNFSSSSSLLPFALRAFISPIISFLTSLIKFKANLGQNLSQQNSHVNCEQMKGYLLGAPFSYNWGQKCSWPPSSTIPLLFFISESELFVYLFIFYSSYILYVLGNVLDSRDTVMSKKSEKFFVPFKHTASLAREDGHQEKNHTHKHIQ